MIYKGDGTQQIEEIIKEIFPTVRSKRMDWDSTRGKWSFDNIINSFANNEIDILIGTQMVTKGLDFKNVNLVGVLNADHFLNFPDFRAHEKAFQVLTQEIGTIKNPLVFYFQKKSGTIYTNLGCIKPLNPIDKENKYH